MTLIQQTILSCTTHRGLCMQTLGSIQSCPFKGVSLSQGITDVALARCLQYKLAVHAAREHRAAFVLFVDDDMQWTPQLAEQVLQECAEKNAPVSGRYVVGDLTDASLAATPMPDHPGKYLTGLGFLAVSIAHLEAVLDATPRVKWKNQALPGVTACGPVGDQWVSEDQMLTMRLGGVFLSSVEVGHIKPVTLLPSMFPHLKIAPATSSPSGEGGAAGASGRLVL